MPKYLVRLEAPVVYMPDNFMRRRELTELEVFSDSEAAAVAHVHKTTTGLVLVASIDQLKP